ncbi:MAG: Fe-S cluster assembly protein SufD [Leptolyngbyaceae cyanobacterium SM1_1_3]|nr:Fe-S cluster assembly protein SufD [Leptolyngbyaceae cyanobacterium SM1_1_3]NJN04148.1 Fe-S cluster assembly protein SufD [Leptolyngbyaceae cyanobacterium RM1_1_2]
MGLQVSENGMAKAAETYLSRLLSVVAAEPLTQLALPELRQAARALVQEQSFPSARDEEWRFSDISELLALELEAAKPLSEKNLEAIAPIPNRPETQNSRLVFVNGVYVESLSSRSGLPQDVTAGSLANLCSQPELKSQIEQRLGHASGHNEVFTALNTAGFQDAAVIWVPRQVQLSTPIQLVHYALTEAQTAVISQPRCLVLAETGSHLTLVEEYYSRGQGQTFVNAVMEVWLEANAQIDHVRLQDEAKTTFHIAKTAVTQARDSRYTCTAVDLGSQVSRHHLEIYQTGEQTETRLYGLSAIAGDQLSDTHSLISLSQPHGSADQLHKCIISDRAHAVFSGKVYVSQSAQHTQAAQLNRNLLLSDKSRVDTKPQLEIIADNVKCAHGATVSQLAADEIFYLQSRGISPNQAQQLLIYGFAMEIIEKITIASLRESLTQQITEWTRW